MICGFLMLWMASQAVSAEAVQHMQAGIEADNKEHCEVAVGEFRKAAELAPNLAEAVVGLGRAYMENHEYGAAVAPLKRAVELNPDLLVAHEFLGYVLLAQGYAAEAIPHLEHAGARDALGIAQVDAGQLAEAVVNLREAVAKRPNDPDLLYYLGRASGLLSKQSIDQLLAVDPEAPRAHQAMGENYFVLRQMPQAEKEYQEALRLRPDLPGLPLELGLVYARASQWNQAEQELRVATKLATGHP